MLADLPNGFDRGQYYTLKVVCEGERFGVLCEWGAGICSL